ncbi:MAG: hypothetical protein AAB664_00995 [Patescibacteria group bacterium]
MPQIIPAFLVKSEQEFEQKLRLVEHACSLIQVDILDGSLFNNVCWFDPIAIGQLTTSVEMELHLMVENPIPIIEEFQKHVPNLKRAIVTAEMHRPTGAVIAYIKDVLKLEAGVAINPETPLHEIEDVIHLIDQLTIMGVHPGQSGQAFLGEMILDKIKAARHHRHDLMIEMDGGLTEELIQPLLDAGANRLCAASLLFKDENPQEKLRRLYQTFHL